MNNNIFKKGIRKVVQGEGRPHTSQLGASSEQLRKQSSSISSLHIRNPSQAENESVEMTCDGTYHETESGHPPQQSKKVSKSMPEVALNSEADTSLTELKPLPGGARGGKL